MRITKYEQTAWRTHDSASNEFIARKEIVTEKEKKKSFIIFFFSNGKGTEM